MIKGDNNNNSLTGGGGNNTFIFAPNFGQDTIADFHPGEDTIQIDHTVFADFNDLMTHALAVGSDTVISDAANDSITLKSVALANLHASDFNLCDALTPIVTYQGMELLLPVAPYA